MRVVLDTNVLISAFFWKGNERNILKKCRAKEHQLIISPQILREMRRVLSLKFSLPDEKINEYERDIILFSVMVVPKGELKIVKDDPTDDIIIETAQLGKADVIVTGNKHLTKLKEFEGIRIKRAGEL